ncbi:MAG: SigE family RNA polymerase sigma factor [Actinomycetota bacterium]|nr:SigE family RNA polymerase sigma factor [Actinomycetota bacterium]
MDFEEFASAAMPTLLRFGHVLTGDALRAEELVQQALVSTWGRWRGIEHDQPLAYVKRAMVHAHTSMWRRSRREARFPTTYDPAAPEGPDLGERDRTVTALRLLPPRQRAVVVLRYYEDLSEADIARVLGCSPGTVKSQASKALQTLRAHLTPDLETTR